MARQVTRLEVIRARLAAGTPGPWHHVEGILKHYVHSENDDLGFSLQDLHPADGREWPCAETAELIANLPADLGWAIEEIERLGTALRQLEEAARLVAATPEAIRYEDGEDGPQRVAAWLVDPAHMDALRAGLAAARASSMPGSAIDPDQPGGGPVQTAPPPQRRDPQ